jgi:hypothetical protein
MRFYERNWGTSLYHKYLHDAVYLCQNMRQAHLDALLCVKEFLSKDEADRHFSEVHSNEKTNVME